jgi:pimeloyl-ACP methyl ester carboxylesterase
VNEFADLAATSANVPTLSRRWVNVITGGHISGVFWGTGTPEVVLLHDGAADGNARSWDEVLLALDRPAVALDLPGHGRSNDNPGADNSPVRAARPVIEAIRSFAPRHRAVVGRGLGALVALAAAGRAPGVVGRIILVDTLPETSGGNPEHERLWARLAALSPPPVLVRDAISDAAVDRLRRESPAAQIVALGDADPGTTDRSKALAGVIAAALTREESTP